MATITWKPTAAALRQIDTITVANTWAAGDVVTLTMNNKDLVVTIGATGTSTALVAAAIRDAWNAQSRLDSEGATDATSNFGGQEFGEYAEATASIDDDSTSVVLITGNTAGRPFTLTVTETTAGDGTATEATSQAATGPNHWNNADNWSAGGVPVDDDGVIFRDSDVSVLFGLPNGTLEVTIQQYQSYTGSIGLPEINRWNAAKPYPEYRQRYVRLDDAGTGTDIAHRFGIGQVGTGSPLINLKHSTLKCSPVVFNTGTPQIAGTKALNICATAATSTINILNGSVDFSSQDGSTSQYLTITQSGGDSRGITPNVAGGSLVTMAGGTMLLGGAVNIATVKVLNGTLRFEDHTGTIALFTIEGGTVDYASTGTLTVLIVGPGTFDARSGAGTFTVTDGDVYAGGRFLDPYGRMSVGGSNFQLHFEPSADLQFGASQGTPIVIAT